MFKRIFLLSLLISLTPAFAQDKNSSGDKVMEGYYKPPSINTKINDYSNYHNPFTSRSGTLNLDTPMHDYGITRRPESFDYKYDEYDHNNYKLGY